MRFRIDTRSRIWLLLTVASSLAASTLLAALVSAHLIQPLPFPADDRLVAVAERARGSEAGGPISGGTAEEVRTRSRQIAQLGTYSVSDALLTTANVSSRVQLVYASEHLFDALGARPVHGPSFVSTCALGRQVFVSDTLWRRMFGADVSAVGRSIEVNGRQFTVAGVVASSSVLPREGDLWTCDPLTRPMGERERRDRYRFGVARLRHGTTLEAAEDELGQLSGRLSEEHPSSNGGWTIVLQPLRLALLGATYEPLLLLAVLSPLILVLGAINVAGAVAALMEGARGRWQLESALGARVRQIAVPVAGTLMTLLAFGAILGGAITEAAFHLLRPFATEVLPFGTSLGWDTTTTSFLVGGTFAMGVVATGLGLQLVFDAHRHPEAVLSGEGSRHHVGLGRLRHCIVGGQLAVASFVVFLGTWLLSNYVGLVSAGVGYDPAHLLVADVSLRPTADLARPWAHLVQSARELIANAERDPRVRAATVGSLPPGSNGVEVSLVPEGAALTEAHAAVISVADDFFEDSGVRLLEGRTFTTIDRLSDEALSTARGAEGVVVLSDRAARTLWPEGRFLGRRVRLQPDFVTTREVVGVVATAGGRVAPEDVVRIYVPYAQAPRLHFDFLVRLRPGGVLTDRELAALVEGVDPRLTVTRVRQVDDILMAAARLPLALTGSATALAAVALLLSLAGVYSLSRYVTTRQAPALAVRVALGSTPSRSARAAVEHQRPALFIGGIGGLFLTLLWIRLFTPTVPWLMPASLQQFAGVSVAMLLAAAFAAAHPSWLLARGPIAPMLQPTASHK